MKHNDSSLPFGTCFGCACSRASIFAGVHRLAVICAGLLASCGPQVSRNDPLFAAQKKFSIFLFLPEHFNASLASLSAREFSAAINYLNGVSAIAPESVAGQLINEL